jgi:hypothetical protein
MGEQFALTITCAVVETSSSRTVPAPNQFEPTSVQVAPFEVLNGTRHEDIVAPPYRYFQYQYTLRLMADRSFGQDVDIPSIKIVYNVQFTAGRGAGSGEGRDLTYVLPAIPIRIVSLVPRLANDIPTSASRRARRSATSRSGTSAPPWSSSPPRSLSASRPSLQASRWSDWSASAGRVPSWWRRRCRRV